MLFIVFWGQGCEVAMGPDGGDGNDGELFYGINWYRSYRMTCGVDDLRINCCFVNYAERSRNIHQLSSSILGCDSCCVHSLHPLRVDNFCC
jgi:hypothetical protein